MELMDRRALFCVIFFKGPFVSCIYLKLSLNIQSGNVFMSKRPRQIDYSKPFQVCETLESFNRAEGTEQDVNQSTKIITPCTIQPTRYSYSYTLREDIHSIRQKETQLKLVQPWGHREDYIKYKIPVHPTGNQYECNEADLRYLQQINDKQTIQLTIQEFEQYLALLDIKSGKDIIIDWQSFIKENQQYVPKRLQQLSDERCEKIYYYWRTLREDFKRPLLRQLMYPYYEDTNPFLAFRPRNPPNNLMRLRRPQQQSNRGLNEMELIGQRLISLKKDFSLQQQIVELCLQREKAAEIDKRAQFCKFSKEMSDTYKSQGSEEEMKLWLRDCFVRETENKVTINIVNRLDDVMNAISQEVQQWKQDIEKIKKEAYEREKLIQQKEIIIDEIIKEKRTDRIIQQPIILEQIQKVSKDEVDDPKPRPQPIIDDKNDIIGRFLATLYTEAKKFKLTFEQVTNDPQKLQNYSAALIKKSEDKPLVGQKQVMKFGLLYNGHDLIYRTQQENFQEQYYWEPYAELAPSNSLFKQYQYFKPLLNQQMELADQDQMLYGQQGEDDKHDEEDLKQIRKKIKTHQNRNTNITNGNGRY
ncbi:hypothetical protein pb186bvf_010349 [Paramecium bursaria]